MYAVPSSGTDDPYLSADPSMGGSDPYSDPFGGMNPTWGMSGGDPYSDPFGGDDPEFNLAAQRAILRLPYNPER